MPADQQVYPNGNPYRLLAVEELPVIGTSVDSTLSGFPADRMLDGSQSTQWASGNYRATTAWAAVELSAAASIASVGLKTGPSNGTSYDIQTSDDGTNWTTRVTGAANTTWNMETKTLPAGSSGKFVRILWRNSTTNPQARFSIYELLINGEAGAAPPSPSPTATPTPTPTPTASPSATPTPTPTGTPTSTPTSPPTGTVTKLTPTALIANSSYSGVTPERAVDGNLSSQWSNGGYRESEAWLRLQYGGTYRFDRVTLKTGALPAGVSYQIEVSDDGNAWTPASGRLTNTTWQMETKVVSGQGQMLRVRFFNNPSAPVARFTIYEVEVYGSRVSAEAPNPVFPIATGPGAQWRHKSAFNSSSSENFVVWAEGGSPGAGIRAQRIALDGRFVGTPVTLKTNIGSFRDVAYNPQTNEYVICYEEGQRNVYLQRVSPTGQLIGSPVVSPGLNSGDFYGYARMAYNGSRNEYVVAGAYHRYDGDRRSGVRVQRFSAQLQPLGEPVILGNDFSTWVSVSASAGAGTYLVSYGRSSSAVGGSTIYGTLISSDGAILGPEFTIGNGLSHETAYNWRAGEFYVTWGDYLDDKDVVLGRRIKDDGTQLGETRLLVSDVDRAYFPNVSYNGRSNGYLMVYDRIEDRDVPNADIYGLRLNSDGSPNGTSFPVLQDPNGQMFPAITFNYATNRFLVTWDDDRGEGTYYEDKSEVYGRFVE